MLTVLILCVSGRYTGSPSRCCACPSMKKSLKCLRTWSKQSQVRVWLHSVTHCMCVLCCRIHIYFLNHQKQEGFFQYVSFYDGGFSSTNLVFIINIFIITYTPLYILWHTHFNIFIVYICIFIFLILHFYFDFILKLSNFEENLISPAGK